MQELRPGLLLEANKLQGTNVSVDIQLQSCYCFTTTTTTTTILIVTRQNVMNV